MLNSIEKYMALVATVSSVIGRIMISVGKIYDAGIPAVKGVYITLNTNPKYNHLKIRLNNLRDLGIKFCNEATLLVSEATTAIQSNPEDFSDVINWAETYTSELDQFKPEVESIKTASEEWSGSNKAAVKEFLDWVEAGK